MILVLEVCWSLVCCHLLEVFLALCSRNLFLPISFSFQFLDQLYHLFYLFVSLFLHFVIALFLLHLLLFVLFLFNIKYESKTSKDEKNYRIGKSTVAYRGWVSFFVVYFWISFCFQIFCQTFDHYVPLWSLHSKTNF